MSSLCVAGWPHEKGNCVCEMNGIYVREKESSNLVKASYVSSIESCQISLEVKGNGSVWEESGSWGK